VTPEQRLTHRQIADTIATIMRRYAAGDWGWMQDCDELDDLRILARHMREMEERNG